MFPEQIKDDVEPWGGVRQVWAFGSPQANHAVDTTDTFDLGVESLKAHRAYIDGLGWENWDPQEFLEGFARPVGQRLDVAFAAPFEVFPMGWATSRLGQRPRPAGLRQRCSDSSTTARGAHWARPRRVAVYARSVSVGLCNGRTATAGWVGWSSGNSPTPRPALIRS